jgi:hypothetical protein
VAVSPGAIVITNDRLQRVFSYSWWILCPALFLLVVRFSYERGCLDPYELLQPLMRHQSLALIIAALYTGAHVWIVAAAVSIARARTSYGIKIVLMALVIALEQIPRVAWSWLYHAFGIC